MSLIQSESEGQPKKRRRQNVACDPCKFRRVKCDLSDLLFAHADSDVSRVDDPAASLPDLVRANPGLGCTNCSGKGVKCTSEQILNPSRPNRGGKRIDQAKVFFGKEGTIRQDERTGYGSAGERVQDATKQLSEPLPYDFGSVSSTFDWGTLPTFPGSSVEGEIVPTGLRNMEQIPPEPGPPWNGELLGGPEFVSLQQIQSQQSPYQSDLLPGLPTERYNFSHTDAISFDYAEMERLLASQQASSSYHQLAVSPPREKRQPEPVNSTGWIADISGGLRRGSPADIWRELADHRSDKTSSLLQTSGTTERQRPAEFSSFLGSELEFDEISQRSALRLDGASPRVPPVPRHPNESAGSQQHLVSHRKRTRSVLSATHDEPWKLWSDVDKDNMFWGRREVMQERLADRALGGELSKHLVNSFFHCVHPSFPALSPEGFYLEWTRAGQCSDMMTPAQEALCAVMEAWGARYSDSAIVLGLSPSRAALAPKVIQPDGTLAPGSQVRAHWGRARLGVCNALIERARKLIDSNGLLRRPTVTGIQALLLYNQLLHLSDQQSRAAGQFMENQMIHSAIIEQLKLLQLMWRSNGEIPNEEGELPTSIAQLRMKQRRIYWTVFISDAFNAAASGDLPRIPDEELDAVHIWLTEVEANLPLSTFKVLAFFISCYYRIARVARVVARRITHPNLRPGTVDVSDFCAAVRECWAQLKSVSKDITVITAELLQTCKESLIGFSPLTYIINLRMSCPFVLLIMHQAIKEQLEFRKKLGGSFIFVATPSSNSSSSKGSTPSGLRGGEVAVFEEIHLQSIDVLLHSCRSQMEMYKTIIPTGMIQTATIFLRVLIATAQFLAEVPTVEQGYPADTLGGCGWDWKTKQAEVDICVQSLYQLGWAWADVAEVLDSVMVSMERMTPSQDQLDAYRADEVAIDETVAVALLKEEEADEKLLRRAMTFWPPESIPAVIESAMADLRVDDTPLDLTSPSIPFDELRQISSIPHRERRLRPLAPSGPSASSGPSGSAGSAGPTTSGETEDHFGPSSLLSDSLARMGKSDQDIAKMSNTVWPHFPWTEKPPIMVVTPASGISGKEGGQGLGAGRVDRNTLMSDFRMSQTGPGWTISGMEMNAFGKTTALPPATVGSKEGRSGGITRDWLDLHTPKYVSTGSPAEVGIMSGGVETKTRHEDNNWTIDDILRELDEGIKDTGTG